MRLHRLVCLAALLVAGAAETAYASDCWTTRQYMGKPPIGPTMPAPRYHHPCSYRILGIRVCKTPKQRYENFLHDYEILNQAREDELLHVMRFHHVRAIDGYQCQP